MSKQSEAGLTEHHHATAEQSAEELARRIVEALHAGVTARGRASLIVSGGRSPVPLFHALQNAALDWSKVWISLADERWVDSESTDSNEYLVREHLLKGRAAAAHFVPLKTPDATPQQALVDRSLALEAMPQPFDAVVLGMGEDGHTASLFPQAEGLESALRPKGIAVLAAIIPPVAPHSRMTLTLATLLRARRIFLPIHGATKLAVYRRARANASPLELPVAAIVGQQLVAVEVFLTG